LLLEAVATIHRAVLAGLEGDLGVLAALGTDGGVHLSRALSVAAAAVAATRLATGRTALRLVSVTLFSVVGLIVGAEDESLAALLTGDILILVAHR